MEKHHRNAQRRSSNRLVGIASMSDDEMKMVLSVGSDTNPGDYYLYDQSKNSLAYLGSTRPWIDPKTMAPMKPFSFATSGRMPVQ